MSWPDIPTPDIPIPDIPIPDIPSVGDLTDQLNSLNLSNDAKDAITQEAEKLANNYKSENPNGDFEDCVTVVASGAAAAGASVGGPLGAALGAGAGIPAARIACRRIFKE